MGCTNINAKGNHNKETRYREETRRTQKQIIILSKIEGGKGAEQSTTNTQASKRYRSHGCAVKGSAAVDR